MNFKKKCNGIEVALNEMFEELVRSKNMDDFKYLMSFSSHISLNLMTNVLGNLSGEGRAEFSKEFKEDLTRKLNNFDKESEEENP